MSFRLDWSERALSQLAAAADWSPAQAAAVVNAMEWLAATGFSLGRRAGEDEEVLRYWPVPPLGAFYVIEGSTLRVVRVVDPRRRDAHRL